MGKGGSFQIISGAKQLKKEGTTYQQPYFEKCLFQGHLSSII